MGSLRGWSGCNSRLFFWIYQSIAWQGVFLCSFFFLSCIGYGASWGHRIVQHTHPSPFFLFLCRQLISSSSFLHFVGGVHGKRHEAYMARYQAFLYGGGGRIYSTRQLGGRGEDDISGSFKSPLCFVFFGLDSLLQNLAGLETVLWLFSFSLLGVMSFCCSSSLPTLGFLYLSLSLSHVSHSRLLVVLPSRRLFLLVDTHAEHVSTMCAERDGRDDDLCPWMDDGWTRGCTEQDGLVSRVRRPTDDDDEDKVERWMDDLEQRWTSW